MRWDGMAWDGMGWDGMRWHGMGWAGMACDGMAWDARMEWMCLAALALHVCTHRYVGMCVCMGNCVCVCVQSLL